MLGEIASPYADFSSLQWRHNGRDSVSNHQPQDCLLNPLFRCRSKKTSKLRVTGLCAGNSPGTGEFPAQMASNAENVSIWWYHHCRVSFRGKSYIAIASGRNASLEVINFVIDSGFICNLDAIFDFGCFCCKRVMGYIMYKDVDAVFGVLDILSALLAPRARNRDRLPKDSPHKGPVMQRFYGLFLLACMSLLNTLVLMWRHRNRLLSQRCVPRKILAARPVTRKMRANVCSAREHYIWRSLVYVKVGTH